MKKKSVVTIMLFLGMFSVMGCQTAKKNGAETEALSDEKQETQTTDYHTQIQSEENAKSDTEQIVTGTSIENQNQLSDMGEAFTWQEITVTIPEKWKDKYILEESEDGFYFYQKASYEKLEGMGYLCGFTKSDELMNYGAGESLLAYTDDGIFYYLMQPTDVACDVENEAIANEYFELIEGITWMKASIQISVEDIHYDAEQFVFPNSSIQKLEDYHVMNLSNNELRIARNEIYARHGRVFENEYLQNYFDSCSWYQAIEGKTEVEERELSEIEKANLEKILSAEIAFDEAHPYPLKYQTGTSVLEPVVGDGLLHEVIYEVSEHSDYQYDCILTIDGTVYDLEEFIYMEYPVMDRFYITDFAGQAEISGYKDGLEIAVLDEGPSNDPVTHFFKYNGELIYIGAIPGFPFGEENNGVDGFIYQNGVIGRMRMDLIETAYVDGYWWYDNAEWKLEYMETGIHKYQWRNAHQLFMDIPVYAAMDENSPITTLKAQKEVYFIETDLKEWIFVRGKDGASGYIRVKDGKVLNVDELAENVFSDLYFFD